MRCLIVDDSADFRDAAGAMLGRAGFDVVAVAATGADAVRLARELEPDLALVDIDLGGESGFDVAEALVAADLPTIPAVILISTYAEQDLAEMIAVSPAVGFVSKFALSGTAIRDLLDGRVSELRDR
ncbi:response regulator [Mycobacterium sp. PS03-16]|uniref:response regulator n=1 Tax=Mycobacterium sp. PS03-16 TaxID=2559611 RepID=UPI001074735B|nr:response regulator [Mycobacterium sp. PS03-16]TFV61603.1 response regulator [Mycobacterium sp. PS03-16]